MKLIAKLAATSILVSHAVLAGIVIGTPLVSGHVVTFNGRQEMAREELSRAHCRLSPDGSLNTGPGGASNHCNRPAFASRILGDRNAVDCLTVSLIQAPLARVLVASDRLASRLPM
jgi:hypothetical protein